jgi:catechol 2,3-dioxygenase-like lactoylglutathione lyase family enzyme
MSAHISHVRGLALGAPKASQSVDFYRDAWGLRPVVTENGVAYFRGTGAEHHILALHDMPEPMLVAIELAAHDRSGVDALCAQAVAAGATYVTAPAPLTTPGGGYGFELRDPDGRVVRISADVAAAELLPADEMPGKVSHIVLNTPDIARMERFYAGLFGFVVSDRSEDLMVFIRCDRSHHNIAFNKNPFVSFNHVSFEMASFEAVMKGIGRMARAGWPVKWGTGCHGIGHIMFAYFIDPNGFTIEYNYYVKPFVPELHQPRTHVRGRENMDAWGTAGMPGEEIRAAMRGTPAGNPA